MITPYAGGANEMQTRGKTITTTMGLRVENNTRTPGCYNIKNPKRGILNYIVWMSGRHLEQRCKKILQTFYKLILNKKSNYKAYEIN
jgi:hypothetical protein